VREHGVGCDKAARDFLPAVGVCEPVKARSRALYSPEVDGKMKEEGAKRQEEGEVACIYADACSYATARCAASKLPPV
jgi:hypothetical protein